MSRKSVLVDIPKLQAARLAKGYVSALQLDIKLHSLGYKFVYRAVEYKPKGLIEKRISLDHAIIISKFLEIPFDAVFHSEALSETELKLYFENFSDGDFKSDILWDTPTVYMTWDDLYHLTILRKNVAQQKRALYKIRGNTPRTAELKTAIKDDLHRKTEQIEHERARVKCYVDGITDEYIRKVIKLHFLDSLPWYLVAAQFYADEGTIRKMAFSYIYQRSGFAC